MGVYARAAKLVRGFVAQSRVSAPKEHQPSLLSELACHFEPDTTISPGNERERFFEMFRVHG